MPLVLINGLQTYYEDDGRGTPVLFIHGGFGGAESALYWKPSVFRGVLPSDRFRTITYDRRGCGRSAFVEAPYSLTDLAADARGLLDHLQIERAIVVGDSLGGVVALQMALAYPERVRSLILAETGAALLRVSLPERALLGAARALPLRPFLPLVRSRLLRPQFYDPLGPLTADEIAERRRHHREYTQRLATLSDDELYHYSIGLLRNYAAFAGVDLTPELPRLGMPIDIMHGTADNVVRFAAGVVMHASLPHASFHTLPGLGHGLFYYPEARNLARAILEARATDFAPAMAGERSL